MASYCYQCAILCGKMPVICDWRPVQTQFKEHHKWRHSQNIFFTFQTINCCTLYSKLRVRMDIFYKNHVILLTNNKFWLIYVYAILCLLWKSADTKRLSNISVPNKLFDSHPLVELPAHGQKCRICCSTSALSRVLNNVEQCSMNIDMAWFKVKHEYYWPIEPLKLWSSK